ncbi:Methyltransferase domain-containing protein [Butyrivibrio sp. INlla18]|uniref:class I SAM-dependent methyltransferase n=1 Tax=Butyrivibrio sp. INlla18 TaxID=1520806 RepID=UPI00088F5468|nr:class I SAM-dependent methyltransferase [Butyrivibrio sp. INlla18]SDA79221.1 Methyltransferase domain-containing protein [Butyrivibrio sp. INlla18]
MNIMKFDELPENLVKIDIGCGRRKQDGFIGIVNSPYSMADHVLDLNKDPLPFEDNSVDYVFSSHCLEHLENLEHILAEIYRVCKDRAQIFITVPYYQQSANFANIYHNNQIAFNEHTFRFFSSDEECDIPKEDWVTPSCQTWGLKYSANSENGIEIRTRKIEYIYYPEYENLSEEEKRRARKKYNNVVDIINYYLEVIKDKPSTIKKESLIIEPQVETIRKQNLLIQEQRKLLDERYDLIVKLQEVNANRNKWLRKMKKLLKK